MSPRRRPPLDESAIKALACTADSVPYSAVSTYPDEKGPIMRTFKITIATVATMAGLSAIALATTQQGAVPCTSGDYAGKTTKGHSISFTVDCARKAVTDVAVKFRAICTSDKHKETGQVTYSGPARIKKQTFPNPEGGPRETVYVLAYNKQATSLVANGVEHDGEVLLRVTTPPTGRIKGTFMVDYSYGELVGDPPEYQFSCYGPDATTLPAKFTARRK